MFISKIFMKWIEAVLLIWIVNKNNEKKTLYNKQIQFYKIMLDWINLLKLRQRVHEIKKKLYYLFSIIDLKNLYYKIIH